MTINSTVRKAGPYYGNSATTLFPFSFKVFDKTNIGVVRAQGTGAGQFLTLDSDYSVTLNVDQNNNPGGSIAYPLSGAPLPPGYSLVILGVLPYDQPTDLTNQGGFYPQTIEDMVDRAEIQIQQLAEISSRALQFPAADTASPALGSASDRANAMLGFDASGNATLLPLPASIGAGDMKNEVWTDGIDYVSGVSTFVTLSRSYTTKANLGSVVMAGVAQDPSSYRLDAPGNKLTFLDGSGNATVIPVGLGKIWCTGGTTLSLSAPATQSVGDAALAPGSMVFNRTNDQVWITDFGATPALDASPAAILAAQKCQAHGGGTVRIPAGTWKIGSPLPQYANVEYVGEGRGVTILQPMNVMTMLSLAYATETIAYVAVRNLTISPSVAGVKAISWTLCRFTEIENVDFIGCTGNNFEIDRGLGHTVSNVNSVGKTGLAAGAAKMYSSVDTDYVSHATVQNYKLINQGTGVASQGLYLRRAIDFEVTDVHAYGADGCTVMVIENDSQAVKVKGLNVDGCAAGVLLQQGAGVAVVPTFTSIANSHIDQATAYGMQASGAQYTTLDDVMFTPKAGFTTIPALSLSNDLNTKVNACRMYGFSGAPSGAAIQLSNTNNLTVRNTDAPGCYIGVGFAGVCQNIDIEMDFTGCTNPIGGSPAGTNNRFRPHLKGLAVGAALVPVSPAMPASGVAYTNNTAFTCRVSVMGGTFNSITLNGVSTGVSNNSWSGEVQPGETIAVVYTVAPNWWWVGK